MSVFINRNGYKVEGDVSKEQMEMIERKIIQAAHQHVQEIVNGSLSWTASEIRDYEAIAERGYWKQVSGKSEQLTFTTI